MKTLNLNIRYVVGVICTGVLLLVSCQRDTLLDPNDNEGQDAHSIVVSRKLENPYSVQNMNAAYENLKNDKRIEEDVKVATTHLYVRFFAKDTSDIRRLEQDKDLEYFATPLDYELSEIELQRLHAKEKNKWFYTVVPQNYQFPEVRYEILEDLYLPYKVGLAKNNIADTVWNILEEEALKITDNIDEDQVWTKAKKWNPSGTITVEERGFGISAGKYIPVKGCKVRVRRWFDWASTKTNARGHFFIKERFKKKVNYSIEFETTGFKVTNFLGHSINYDGPKKKGAWDKRFSYNNQSKNWVSATFVNAITDFRTQAILHDLKLPGSLVTMKVRPKFESGTSNALGVIRHATPFIDLLKTNDVVIYTKFDDGTPKLTDDLYQVMMHELGHVTHFLKSPVKIAASLGIVNESWATALEYYFTKPYYPRGVSGLPDQSREGIIEGTKNSWQYTPFFIDLSDTSNQRKVQNNDAEYADDNVQYYTLNQMQKALDKETELVKVARYLRDKVFNPSSRNGNMDRLVSFYEDIRENH